MAATPHLETRDPTVAPLGVQLGAAHVAWDHRVLFDGLDVELPAGRWTCLLGPSGVGKSMLLRLILGLDGGTAGNSGRVTCSDGEPLAGRAAFMAQDDLLYPWLTVLDNVTLGPRLRHQPLNGQTRDRARALLDDVGLSEQAEALPATLSGGMRQRAALARTLLEDRPVVLMDEPFSALDAITRVRLQDLAAKMLSGRTVLLVTHDPLEALRLGDAIHVMSGRPAKLDHALVPPGDPPRRVDDREILALQGELLRRLAEAAK